MLSLEIMLSVFILLIGLRTLAWHLQCWQIREYRFDRMKAWLNTKDGKSYFVPWFFKGLLPRPKISGRVLLITITILLFATTLLVTLIFFRFNCSFPCMKGGTFLPQAECLETCRQQWFNHFLTLPLTLLLWERSLWLQTIIAVWISKFPVWLSRKHLFNQAHNITRKADRTNLTTIAITGSYGKSSTKELLVHLLKSEFGDEAVLYNPANQNNEVAIARLIIQNKEFFKSTPSALRASPPKLRGERNKKFFVVEAGAYRAGEIAQVCCFTKPCIGILTGLNQQHVELFGSFKIIKNTKFELAESADKTVFFNADNQYLQQIFTDRAIKATPVPISLKAAKNIQASAKQTTFEAYGQKFILPWPGEFFVQNALLALECAREQAVSIEHLAAHLKDLAPLERALNLNTHAQGFAVLHDTYSANPDGVLSAIAHLKNFSGRRIFVSIPLRELGGHAETVHQQIFEALSALNAEVYWEKTDFTDMGKKILGDKFHLLNNNFSQFEALVKNLKNKDVVLLESKLSSKVLKLFK